MTSSFYKTLNLKKATSLNSHSNRCQMKRTPRVSFSTASILVFVKKVYKTSESQNPGLCKKKKSGAEFEMQSKILTQVMIKMFGIIRKA